MALKKLIDEAAHAALDAGVQALYTKGADGKYHLDVEDDDGDELKRAKEHERTRRLEAEQKLRDREAADAARDEELRLEREKAAKASGDMDALEESWKEKHAKDVAAAKAEAAESGKALKAVFVDKVARDIANAISTVPELLLDVIKKRLDLEIHDGVPVTRVLGPDGKPSALNIQDLQKEFVDNKSYAAIIKGSESQGGGAGDGGEGGGAPAKKLSEMTATEEAKFANENPEAYKRMVG